MYLLSTVLLLALHWGTAPMEWKGTGAPQVRVVPDTTVALGTSGLIEIESGAGDVLLTGWGEAGVRVAGGRGQRNYTIRGTRTTVVVSRRAASSRSAIEVSVPEGARVLVRLSSGTLTARDLSSDVEVQSQAGRIDLAQVDGAIDVTSISGSVSVRNAGSSIRVSVVAGRVSLDNVEGDVHVDGVDGDISITDVRARVLDVKTVSGSIMCSSDLPRNASWSMESFAGAVRARLPRTASALFTMESFAGTLRSDIPMTLESSTSGRGPGVRRVLRLGEGSARVSLRSFSGAVVVQPLERDGM